MRQTVVRTEELNTQNFGELPNFSLFPYSCKYCAYWESLNFDETTKKEDAEDTKRKWFIRVGKEFGNCGFIAYVGDAPTGVAIYAPAKYFPTISRYGLSPSRDAIFLACLYIPKRKLRGKGIGKQLLERVACDLRSRGYGAIEVFVRTSDIPSSNIEEWCTGPLEFFLGMGFKIRRRMGEIALLRKDLGKLKNREKETLSRTPRA